jgi:hypothetical protein
LTETKPTPKPKKPKVRLVAVVGIDRKGTRYEPGDPVELPDKLTADYLERGKVRKETG